MNGKPNQEIDTPHYNKPFELILKKDYTTQDEIKSYIRFHPEYFKPTTRVLKNFTFKV
jgi:hypothetical protein